MILGEDTFPPIYRTTLPVGTPMHFMSNKCMKLQILDEDPDLFKSKSVTPATSGATANIKETCGTHFN